MAARFKFRLESVRQWRSVQRDLEKAKLQALFAELRGIEARRAALAAAKQDAERAVLAAPAVDAQELAALDAHRRYAAAEAERLRRQEQECGARIAAQQAAVRKAEQNVRLLDRLKERRLAEWEAETAREQETLAAETYLAKYARRLSLGDGDRLRAQSGLKK